MQGCILHPLPLFRLTVPRQHRRRNLLEPVNLSRRQVLCGHYRSNQVVVCNPRPALRKHRATVSPPKSWRLPRQTAQAPKTAQAHPLTPTVRLRLRTPPRLSTPAPTGSDSSSSVASVYSPRACAPSQSLRPSLRSLDCLWTPSGQPEAVRVASG